MNAPTRLDSVLVTGAAGFIASRVCELLLDAGFPILALDNLNDAYDIRLKKWRLDRLLARDGFDFHEMDISVPGAMQSLPVAQETDFSAVVNLAARAGVRQSVENPWVYYDTNVVGTLNLLEFCRTRGIPKFVLASTSSVYGDSEGRFREDAGAQQPLSPYAATKKAAEELCYTYHHLHGIDVTVLRYFTVYGPAGRPDMSPFRFTQSLIEGHTIPLYGDGYQSRDFTYIDDIARGTVSALRPMGYEIINLGSGRAVVLNDVIRLLEEATGSKARIRHEPRHPADVERTLADNTKARALLRWSPDTPLSDGIQRLVSWYLQNRDWASSVR